MKRYPMRHVANMRDLGGYPAAGGHTRYGRFIRSDVPTPLEEDELALLAQLGLTTVVDLRSPGECAQMPTPFAQLPNITVHHFSLDDGVVWSEREEEIPRIYLDLVRAPTFVPALRAMAGAPGAVLFNCSAGKDRTGVTAAMLLGLCGVAEADIVADYEVSYTYLLPRLQKMHPGSPSISSFASLSKAGYMRAFLQQLNSRFGGIVPFLTEAGLSPTHQAALRQKLMGD